eukprot:1161102-Pelagomonas_calceolata.AAC.12
MGVQLPELPEVMMLIHGPLIRNKSLLLMVNNALLGEPRDAQTRCIPKPSPGHRCYSRQLQCPCLGIC